MKEEAIIEAEDDLVITGAEDEEILITDRGRCIRLFVQDARRNVKCRLSRLKDEMFFAKSVLLIETKWIS